MDPATLRRVLERLASISRAAASGSASLSAVDIAEAYRSETGDAPSEAVLMQLQRLPGLVPRDRDPGARSFVDEDLLAALQGGALARIIVANSPDLVSRRWVNGLSVNGVRTAAAILRETGYAADTVLATAKRFAERQGIDPASGQLAADCLAVAIELGGREVTLDAHGLAVYSAAFAELVFDDASVDNLHLEGCIVDYLEVGPAFLRSTVRLSNCEIGRVAGVSDSEGLPPGRLIDCNIAEFDDASTNAAVLRLDLTPPVKAVLTVLRKLYLQRGGGRKLSALSRGLPNGPICDAVPNVLHVLESEGLVRMSGEFAFPLRGEGPRVRRILAAGGLSQDSAVRRVARL